MRCFLALPLPPQVVDETVQRLAAARDRWPDLRWIPPERWHLTLVFLGDVSDVTLERLSLRVERVSRRSGPIRLRLEGAGRFDQRVLWLGVGGHREALQRLSASLAAAADRDGVPRESRRFRPHLTVARARDPIDLEAVVASLQDDSGSWFTADRITLVASQLGATVEHRELHAWPLVGPVGPDAA